MDGTSLLPSSTVGSSFKRSYHCVACMNLRLVSVTLCKRRLQLNISLSDSDGKLNLTNVLNLPSKGL